MTSPRIKIESVDGEEPEPVMLNGHAAVNGNGIHLNGKTTPTIKKRRNSDRKDDETPKAEKTVREVEIKHEPEENGLMMNGTHETRSKRGGRRPSFSNGSAEKKKNGIRERGSEEYSQEEPMEEDMEVEAKKINALAICKLLDIKKEIVVGIDLDWIEREIIGRTI